MADMVIDQGARDTAARATELAIRIDERQDAHERACEEFRRELREWQRDSTHQLVAIRGEFRGAIETLSAHTGASQSKLWDKLWNMAYIVLVGALWLVYQFLRPKLGLP